MPMRVNWFKLLLGTEFYPIYSYLHINKKPLMCLCKQILLKTIASFDVHLLSRVHLDCIKEIASSKNVILNLPNANNVQKIAGYSSQNVKDFTTSDDVDRDNLNENINFIPSNINNLFQDTNLSYLSNSLYDEHREELFDRILQLLQTRFSTKVPFVNFRRICLIALNPKRSLPSNNHETLQDRTVEKLIEKFINSNYYQQIFISSLPDYCKPEISCYSYV